MLVSLLPDPKLTVARDSANANALSPMLVTLAGMVILVRLSAFRNAPSPMLVTLAGMVR